MSNYYRAIGVLSFIFLNFLACNQDKQAKKAAVQKPVSSIQSGALEKTLQGQGLVNIKTVDSTIMVDLKYSSTDNFFGEDVYGELSNAYFQEITAMKLKKANQELKEKHPELSLLIYDGVRPLSVQHILWNKLDSIPPKKRKDFVADPQEGSIHNYGCAVDLSIIDTQTNKALDMGTKYDYFGYLAYPRKEKEMLESGQLSNIQYQNRLILRTAMISAGFEPITSEWWHFNLYSRKQAKRRFKIIQ